MKRRDHHLNTGFTLIEILLAITIFSMVLVSIYASWSSVLRGSKTGLDAAAVSQRTRMSIRAIEDALTTAQLYAGNIEYYTFLTDITGEFAWLSFVSRLPSDFPGSGMFGEQNLRRVTFGVTMGEDRRTQLVLTQTPLLSLATETEPYTIVLGKDIQVFALEFWDQQKQEWLMDEMPTNQLPKLLRFTLGMGENVRKMELATRIINIPSTNVTVEMQLGRGLPRPTR